jgi:F-type H+-transporting ATPase subunit delta
MAELIAKNYAEALFDVAIENKQFNNFNEQLMMVMDIFKKYPKFYELYKTPQISNEDKKKIIDEVFKKMVAPEIMNFLNIIIDQRRTAYIESIVNKYRDLVNEHNNRVEAVAITVLPLTEADKNLLQTKLSKMINKNIALKNEVDPSILGGMLVKFGDKVIDGTIQSRLNELKENLAQIIV